VSDAQGDLITAEAVDTELTVLQAIRGSLDLGDVLVSGLTVQAQDLEELLNRLSELPQAPQQEEEDAPLPEIAGNITIENSQLLFTDAAGLVRAFGLAGEVRIPSINQP